MNSASTASASRTADTVAAVHAMTDQYVAANPQARPVPCMSWQEMQRLVARGLVKLPEPTPLCDNGKAYECKEGEPITSAHVRRVERERQRQARLARFTAKLHTEVETRFGHLEKGETA